MDTIEVTLCEICNPRKMPMQFDPENLYIILCGKHAMKYELGLLEIQTEVKIIKYERLTKKTDYTLVVK